MTYRYAAGTRVEVNRSRDELEGGEHLDEHPEQLTTSGRLMLPGGDE